MRLIHGQFATHPTRLVFRDEPRESAPAAAPAQSVATTQAITDFTTLAEDIINTVATKEGIEPTDQKVSALRQALQIEKAETLNVTQAELATLKNDILASIAADGNLTDAEIKTTSDRFAFEVRAEALEATNTPSGAVEKNGEAIKAGVDQINRLESLKNTNDTRRGAMTQLEMSITALASGVGLDASELIGATKNLIALNPKLPLAVGVDIVASKTVDAEMLATLAAVQTKIDTLTTRFSGKPAEFQAFTKTLGLTSTPDTMVRYVAANDVAHDVSLFDKQLAAVSSDTTKLANGEAQLTETKTDGATGDPDDPLTPNAARLEAAQKKLEASKGDLVEQGKAAFEIFLVFAELFAHYVEENPKLKGLLGSIPFAETILEQGKEGRAKNLVEKAKGAAQSGDEKKKQKLNEKALAAVQTLSTGDLKNTLMDELKQIGVAPKPSAAQTPAASTQAAPENTAAINARGSARLDEFGINDPEEIGAMKPDELMNAGTYIFDGDVEQLRTALHSLGTKMDTTKTIAEIIGRLSDAEWQATYAHTKV